ncbi:capsular polysaccharide biosynthesis protein [Allopusillimonas soli]|uniref:Capsular polysaccharide biosynthesis protein n=1 Tax=Allopusillimonas soli TaxID=659016 RepID=A0A853FEI8_9BURK|nr:capsular polysaccharide biosynthesis protein [Allopusillimonas soli]NYT36456.1 capsular polysaccharide biosynthesis protein [Allopusillimonas soli]
MISKRGAEGLTAIAGWGQRPTTAAARAYARRRGLPYISLEDGFLRSPGLSVDGDVTLSMVVDDLGIYYDASRPSRLEALIAGIELDDALARQAGRAMRLIRKYRLSKYNHSPEVTLPAAQPGSASRVLVVDQTFGDMSVSLGGADPDTFLDMLACALRENPGAEVWIKTHPDILAGKKRGYLTAPDIDPADAMRVHVLARGASPLPLLEQMDKVYVVTSQMGFEALMMGKPVVCFGLPWYAGWGLTDDRHAGVAALRARRPVARSVEQLFAAAYMQYARYLNPATAQSGSIFDVIEYLACNKRMETLTRGTLYCMAMGVWKRGVVRPFVHTRSNKVRFVGKLSRLAHMPLAEDRRMVIWGTKALEASRAAAQRHGMPLWRMEDGFLRSVGLGSDLFRAVSLVLDTHGMYYDPASGSDLERMIQRQQLDNDDIARAREFNAVYVASGVSKYNIQAGGFAVDAGGRRVILVPGQVEDDASIRLGTGDVCTNQGLLQAVRAANPSAYIIYKPHPDVEAGNREGRVSAEALAVLADLCANQANIIDCILVADEVHTMTSLSGFEALLHGKVVHCYGGPFYAGWGLTQDHFPLPHRTRRASLEELIFAAILQYPRYALPEGAGVGGYVPAEAVMKWLATQARIMQRRGIGERGPIPAWMVRRGIKTWSIAQSAMEEWRYRRRR